MVEEFSFITGFPLYCPHALPTTSSNLSTLHHRSLGLNDESVATTLFGNAVDFVVLISYLLKNGRAINNAFSHKATILCLLCAFLFIGGVLRIGVCSFDECGRGDAL